jgi:hypothetical protein
MNNSSSATAESGFDDSGCSRLESGSVRGVQPPDPSWNGLYAFDTVDPALPLMPMAARRALDIAGWHVSLAAWQRSPLRVRQALIGLGAATYVDPSAVVAQLRAAGVDARAQPALLDPAGDVAPPEIVAALGPARPLASEAWAHWHALDRYVLAQLVRRGKFERVALAYDEIVDRSKR